jgi:thiol:disulfide interchange protein DsbD
MPSALQTRFATLSNRIRGGKFLSTALMGALSSLVVTACVAPPLVAALAVIGQAGNVPRGALALFALSVGMGTPLLVVGASAGTLLPKAGPWMQTVKAVFGVVFLGVAAWMLDRVLPGRVMMLLWAAVAFAGVWVLLGVGLRGGRRTPPRWAAGMALALYGAVLVAGAAGGGTDPLRPFAGTGLFGAAQTVDSLPFRPIASVAELDQQLRAAGAAGKRTMLDFYADWCVSCKEMEARTFRDPAVRAALAGYVILKADVTRNTADDQALLKRFGIFGPPTTAFFTRDGRERTDFRLVGFVEQDPFRAHLDRFESQQ